MTVDVLQDACPAGEIVSICYAVRYKLATLANELHT